MVYERVNFNEEEIKKMSREDFVDMHIGLFWLDKKTEIRKKMLTQAYGLITAPTKRQRQKSGK